MRRADGPIFRPGGVIRRAESSIFRVENSIFRAENSAGAVSPLNPTCSGEHFPRGKFNFPRGKLNPTAGDRRNPGRKRHHRRGKIDHPGRKRNHPRGRLNFPRGSSSFPRGKSGFLPQFIKEAAVGAGHGGPELFQEHVHFRAGFDPGSFVFPPAPTFSSYVQEPSNHTVCQSK